MQEFYFKEGRFPGPTIKPKRRLWTLLNFLFWATLLLSPLINFAWDVLVSGSPLLIISFMIFLIIGQYSRIRSFYVFCKGGKCLSCTLIIYLSIISGHLYLYICTTQKTNTCALISKHILLLIFLFI